MPYNDECRDTSWDLLEAECGKSHWVRKLFHHTKEEGEVNAILCMPRNCKPSKTLPPGYICQLTNESVLLLFRNDSIEPISVMFNLQISGQKQTWHLLYNGKPFDLSDEEEVPPANGKFWKKFFKPCPDYLPFIASARSDGDGKERVTVKTFAVANDETTFAKIKSQKGITKAESPWLAQIHVDHS